MNRFGLKSYGHFTFKKLLQNSNQTLYLFQCI
jgi:hypothetical protein